MSERNKLRLDLMEQSEDLYLLVIGLPPRRSFDGATDPTGRWSDKEWQAYLAREEIRFFEARIEFLKNRSNADLKKLARYLVSTDRMLTRHATAGVYFNGMTL